jgi:hypothetical protein
LHLQAHADNLEMQSALVVSEPAKVQVAVKARSLHAQAQSLEAQAEAQNLQVLLLLEHGTPMRVSTLLRRDVSRRMSCLTTAGSVGIGGPARQSLAAIWTAWCAAQAHAQAHTDAQTATRAKAEKLAARAEAHGQAQAQAVEAAHRLKRVASMGAQQHRGGCMAASASA